VKGRRAGSALPRPAVLRTVVGFAAGLLVWFRLSPAYEAFLASAAEVVLRLTESPAVTQLEAKAGEILVWRSDFPPAAPRPGLPAADLHFNFVLLCSLFALERRPWRGRVVGAFAIGAAALGAVHVAALVFQVRALYAVHLGAWSADRYGPVARNFWAGGFHFYQIAGRFAAPFAIWWGLRESSNRVIR